MKLKSKILSFPSPKPGITAYENSFYTRPTGLEKMRLRILETADDIFENPSCSISTDNGRTWPESLPLMRAQKTPQGILRGFENTAFVDPVNGHLVRIATEGFFRRDTSDEGYTSYYLKYSLSDDGGRTVSVEDQVIEKGRAPEHPFDHIWIGKNAFMNAAPNAVVRTSRGHLIVPVVNSALGGDGNLFCPFDHVWLEVFILIGRWQSNNRIEWQAGPRITLSTEQSTRGIFEPTIEQMPDGRLLMVMRASNANQPRRPGWKWYSVSSDEGFTWTAPQPWRYTDGTAFYSPSSVSQFLRHSNGRYYWFGNICPHNPDGNLPRYPVVAVEVDPASLMLVKESAFVVETRQPNDPATLQLSNFVVHEDRANGDFILHMSTFFPEADGRYSGSAYSYRLEP
jgi:hypothetical protein